MSKNLVLLSKKIKKIEEDLIRCMQCGMCQAVCPLFQQTKLESDVARGKIFLLKQLGKNLINKPLLVQKYLDRCLLCGSCSFNCPSGVLGDKIFLRARVILKEFLGLSLFEKRILAVLLSSPKSLDFSCSLIKKTSFWWSDKKQDYLLPKIGLKRPILPLADPFWHKQVGKIVEYSSKKLKVALYPGCLVDKVFPEIGYSLIKVLRYLGVGIYFPGVSLCCGLPLLTSGNIEGFKRVILENLKWYNKEAFDYLITPCASCTYALKILWPLYAQEIKEEEQSFIQEISLKTIDISVFLKENFSLKEIGRNKLKDTITYHDPCHLRKSFGLYKEPRYFLETFSSFIDMEDSDACCGFAGSFNLKYFELSKQIGLKKVKNILKTKANIVATSCPACMYQLKLLLQNKSIQVSHLVEVLAKAIN